MLTSEKPANKHEEEVIARVNHLLQNQHLRKGTNCIGTYLYTIGLKPELKAMNAETFFSNYNETLIQKPQLGDLVLFKSISIDELIDGQVIHAAIFLSSISLAKPT